VIRKMLALAAAGAMGTLARYAMGGMARRILGAAFPWGTAAVNLVGCFLAGLLWSAFESRSSITGEMRTVIFMGFMGAFTTFSALALETSHMLRESQWLGAAGNLAMHFGCGLVLLFIGLALGRLL